MRFKYLLSLKSTEGQFLKDYYFNIACFIFFLFLTNYVFLTFVYLFNCCWTIHSMEQLATSRGKETDYKLGQREQKYF